jgi:hypothetical protein
MLEEADDIGALRKPEGDILSKLLQDYWPFRQHKAIDPVDHTTI